MAKECFCGCGRAIPRFPLGTRAINARGRQVVERMQWAEETFRASCHGELAVWYAQGEDIVLDLRAAMHGEIDPRSLDERPVREWQAIGRTLLRAERASTGEIGRAVRTSGLSIDEAAQVLLDALDSGMPPDDAVAALGRGELRKPWFREA